MSITNTLKENSVLIAAVGAIYFLFFREKNSSRTVIEGGNTRYYEGMIR